MRRNYTGNLALAREYVDKYGLMPDGSKAPIRKVARIMQEEHPLRFESIERARLVVNKVLGKTGEKDKKNIAEKHRFETEERTRNPYKLPESDETSYEPFIINAKKLLVLSDIHIPYHSISALTAAFDWGKHRNPDAILLNGDTIDCHMLSRFIKEPKKRDFAGELKIFSEFFDVLKSTFPKAKIYFKYGNHEERYDNFLWMKANELAGVDEFSLENIIKKRADGIEIIKDKRILKAGDLNIIHGHEFGGSVFSPVNIARGLFLKAKANAMQGHNHQTSSHVEQNINGHITNTWSLGCLSELHPAYLPINKWNHGFAFVEVSGKDFQVSNHTIINGKVY